MVDYPLARALIEMLPDVLRVRQANKVQDMIQIGLTNTCRPVAWLTYDYSRTDTHQAKFLSLVDLVALDWQGDAPTHMEKCLMRRAKIVGNTPHHLFIE